MLQLQDCVEGRKVKVIRNEILLYKGIIATVNPTNCYVRVEEVFHDGYYLGHHYYHDFEEMEAIIEEPTNCTCHISLLMIAGCKCGWIQKERAC